MFLATMTGVASVPQLLIVATALVAIEVLVGFTDGLKGMVNGARMLNAHRTADANHALADSGKSLAIILALGAGTFTAVLGLGATF
jgi:hypothetical protein